MNVNPLSLKTIRELAGFSQAELARRTGVSQGHISQIEAGHKRPRPQTVRKLAEAMGVPVGSLLAPSPVPRFTVDELLVASGRSTAGRAAATTIRDDAAS